MQHIQYMNVCVCVWIIELSRRRVKYGVPAC